MASGHGKTSGRGMKGQHARENVRPGFEGGQTPISRRMRKRKGVSKSAMNLGVLSRREWSVINIGQLERFEAGTVVDPAALHQSGLISSLKDGVRVLGEGELTKALQVRAHHFSKGALAKLESAGGQAEVISS